MRTVESLSNVKVAKRKLRNQMRNFRITVKQVGERSIYHAQTVKNALNPLDRYWNQDVVNLAYQMIEEKKSIANSLVDK